MLAELSPSKPWARPSRPIKVTRSMNDDLATRDTRNPVEISSHGIEVFGAVVFGNTMQSNSETSVVRIPASSYAAVQIFGAENNLVVDILYTVVDPRLRLPAGRTA